MSHCVRGSLVFWLLVMTFLGANLGTAYAGKNRERNHGRRAEITDRGSSLDSPSDVLWRDRLLIEDTQPSPSDTNSGLLVRRITPKSVFVAPSFSGCSEGYRQDGMGRCVKLVKVNQAAQLDFILQKLNSMYASSHNSNKNNNNKNENSGPFHVSLPLGTLDNYSSSSNNETPNDKEKQKLTSTEIKHSVVEISSDNIKNNRNNSSSISNSETNTRKTELLHIINLPSSTTKSSQITTVEPQHNTNNNSNTVVNNYEETTTNIFTTDTIILPTTLLTPVESPEENQHTLVLNNFDSTVKREPQNNNENKDLNTKKPFVIVVANSTYHPFQSTFVEHLHPNTEETIPVIGYDYMVTTTEATDKRIQTTTDDIIQDTTSFSTIFNNNNSDTMEAITINDGLTTILSTTTKTTLSNEQPSTFTTTTETTPFDSTIEDSSLHYNTHSTTTTVIPNTSIEEQENEEIGEETKDTDSEGDEESDMDVNTGDPSSIFGAVIHVNSNNNKNIRESIRVPPLKISEISSMPVNLPENTKVNCNYPLRYTESNYGNTNCDPEITTVRYPMRTTMPKQSPTSYFIRFPVDNINSSPSSSSSSELMKNGYKNTNSYVRFPEQSSSIYGSSSLYGSKLWNSEPVGASSTMWYPPSWFPFIQPHRTWSNDDDNNSNNHRNQPSHNQPMSSVYHKQYNQHHLLPQNVPTWINTHSTWPQRD